MYCARRLCVNLIISHARRFCGSNSKITGKAGATEMAESSSSNYDEAYRQLDKLDFVSASKILFSDPPKKKKFGIDFHLVQLFFTCLPSLAVYLVALYARSEMKRMDAELEEKNRIAEEKKTKEIAQRAIQGREPGSDPDMVEMKERLQKVEDSIKEIAMETKKLSARKSPKDVGE